MSLYKFAPDAVQERSIQPFVTWSGGFSDSEIERIIEIGELSNLSKATVGGYDPEDDYSKVRESEVSWLRHNPDTEFLYDKLAYITRQLNGQFYSYQVYGFNEDFQYTKYSSDTKGHYDWHVDTMSGSGMPLRKLSLILQLSSPEEYSGGDLQFMTSANPVTVKKEKGLVTMFPSWTLHRVQPVLTGTRISLVVWVCGDAFK